MAVLKNKKLVGAPFSNQKELVKVVYDFAQDTGAIADYDVLVADGDIYVQLVNVNVITAVTSADACLLDLGKGAGGVEFWSDKLKGALTLASQQGGSLAVVKLAATEKIVLGVEAFDLTAGKLEFIFEVFAA